MLKRRQLLRRRIGRTLGGAVLPLLLLSLCWLAAPEWQDGELSSYVLLFFSGSVTTVFLPWLLFSATSLVAAIWWPRRRRRLWVRLGLAGGVVLSAQYVLALALVILSWAFAMENAGMGFVALCFVALLISPTLPRFTGDVLWLLGPGRRWALGGLGLIYVVLATFFSLDSTSLFDILTAPLTLLLVFLLTYVLITTPLWSLRVYGVLASRYPVWRSFHGRALGSAGLGWAVSWLLALRLSFQRLMLSYAELPTDPPPDCFLATAAARGHASWIGAEWARTSAGERFAATPQLRRFKAAEWLLLALAPRLHRPLRRCYDAVGPGAARLLTHPLAADTVWVLLKPAELAAWFALRVLLGDVDSFTSRIWPPVRDESRLDCIGGSVTIGRGPDR